MAKPNELEVGDLVFHRGLQEYGHVVPAVGLGVSEGWSVYVHFDRGDSDEVLEVSIALLDKVKV